MKLVGDVVAMPKILELTFELIINKVSCPGVWLCQDGMVSLSVFAMGFRYETSLTPPIFPLLFKEVFYFRRRFEASCTMSNIFCLLQDETIYCELVQWPSMCGKDKCTILAQYLGVLNDVLFPSTYCSMDGVDLLMRRSKKFPGILAPKIEISTKVRIDEIFDNEKSNSTLPMPRSAKLERGANPCPCITKFDMEPSRQKSVCHTPMYHRYRCLKRLHHGPQQSRSFLDFNEINDCCDKLGTKSNVKGSCMQMPQRAMIESQFIADQSITPRVDVPSDRRKCKGEVKIKPCICDICRRYHETFNASF